MFPVVSGSFLCGTTHLDCLLILLFASLPPILNLLIILSQGGQEENFSPQTEAELDSTGDDDNTAQRTATAAEVLRRNIPSSRTRVKRNSKCMTEDLSDSDNDSRHERKEHHGESYHSITGVKQALELDLLLCTIFLYLWQGTFEKDT